MNDCPGERTELVPGPWLVPLLTMVMVLTMLSVVLLGPFLPAMSADLDISVAAIGQIPALSMLLAAILGLAAGPLADRYGHRRALIGSLLVATISALGMGLAPGYVVLLIAALLGAGGRAIAQPISVVIAGSSFSGDRQRRAIGWVSAGLGGAVIVGVPVMTTIAELFGWRFALILLAVLSAALILAAFAIVSPDQSTHADRLSIDSILAAYRPLVQHRPTLALVGVSLLGGTSVWIMVTYLGAFYSERFGFTVQQIGWIYFAPGVTLIAGSLAVGGKLGALPPRPFTATMRIVCGLVIAGLLVIPVSISVGLVFLMIQGFTHGAGMAAVSVLLTRESPAGRATTITLNVAALSLSAAIGGALGGLLLAVGDFWMLGVASLFISCAAATLAVVYRDTPERESVVPAPTPAG